MDEARAPKATRSGRTARRFDLEIGAICRNKGALLARPRLTGGPLLRFAQALVLAAATACATSSPPAQKKETAPEASAEPPTAPAVAAKVVRPPPSGAELLVAPV